MSFRCAARFTGIRPCVVQRHLAVCVSQ